MMLRLEISFPLCSHKRTHTHAMRTTADAANAIEKIHWEVFISFRSVRVQINLLKVSLHAKAKEQFAQASISLNGLFVWDWKPLSEKDWKFFHRICQITSKPPSLMQVTKIKQIFCSIVARQKIHFHTINTALGIAMNVATPTVHRACTEWNVRYLFQSENVNLSQTQNHSQPACWQCVCAFVWVILSWCKCR